MSEFNELSQAIGTAVHKATKECKSYSSDSDIVTRHVIEEAYPKIKDLVEHTIKNTEDNE